MEQSFIAYIENSIKNNWDLDALTDYKGATLQYKDVARKIEKLHIIFEESGIRKGDKIAVCGRNSSHWGVTFLATLTYGAVIVPILHEFKADNVHNIVNHSEAKLLLVGDMVWENLNESAMPLLEGILMMNDFTLLVSRSERLTYAREHLNEMFGKKFRKSGCMKWNCAHRSLREFSIGVPVSTSLYLLCSWIAEWKVSDSLFLIFWLSSSTMYSKQ